MGMQRGSADRPAFFRRGVWAGALVVTSLVASGCERVGAERHGPSSVAAATAEEAGRYIVTVGGCNDCHTDGYAATNGQIPESEWLTGSIVGFRGPWGTSYPPNLRLGAQSMTEDQWVEMLTVRIGLPPMPWPSVNRMSDADKRAVYRYLRQLGPKGRARAAALPPDVDPTGPWIDFVPKNLPMTAETGG